MRLIDLFCPISYTIKKEIEQNNSGATISRVKNCGIIRAGKRKRTFLCRRVTISVSPLGQV